jgi:pilus assembly protein Flp/PilA
MVVLLRNTTHLEVELKNILKKFLADESAATAIEYGLIAAGIALAIITAVNSVGTQPEHYVHHGQHLAKVTSRTPVLSGST